MSTTAALLAAALASSAPPLLISPADLAARLAHPDLVVLHIASRASDFDGGHIPGARFVAYNQIAVDGDWLGSELPPVAALVALFESLGISNASRVVVYGSPIAATRLFFTLDYLGHPNVKVLNGGLNAWKGEGRGVERGAQGAQGARGAQRAGRFVPSVQAERVAMADWIRARLETPQMALVDARPDDEFTGADGGMGGAHVAGHLPGARQLVWDTLVAGDGRFLPDDQLRTKLEAAGARPGVPVVSYCMVGMRASVVYFVARHLGFDARMYDGSIVDWTRRSGPVRTGR
jgi:thiosulfate/3-mercaptopyruvate sulfurtransferase